MGLIGLNRRGVFTQSCESWRGPQEHQQGCHVHNPLSKTANCRHRAGRSCANASWISISIWKVAFRAELLTILYFCGRQIFGSRVAVGQTRRGERSEFWHSGVCSPILRRRRYAPEVSLRIEANADQPVLATFARCKVAGDLGGYAAAAGQSFNPNAKTRFQWTGKTNSAPARIHQHGVAVLGERNGRIKAGNTQGNLCTNPCPLAALKKGTHLDMSLSAISGRAV